MVSFFKSRRNGPMGLDLGSQSLKLVQFDHDGKQLVDAARWDIPAEADVSAESVSGAVAVAESLDFHEKQLADALRQARVGREFRGRNVVLCLGARELFVQNIRIPKVAGEGLERQVFAEVHGRLPFPAADAELRYLEAADVRQGDKIHREIIVLACDRKVLERRLEMIERAGLRPLAIDVEPLALLRCYDRQFRRDEDRDQRLMLVNIGSQKTAVVIARGSDALFIKYIDVGGRHLDEALARHLKMPLAEASALRRHNGDRRADQQDPEIARTVVAATRPVVDKLLGELAMCVRYHSVTFRGQALSRLILSGGEANAAMLDALKSKLDLKCELGDPLKSVESKMSSGRKGQWDVAVGLALRPSE